MMTQLRSDTGEEEEEEEEKEEEEEEDTQENECRVCRVGDEPGRPLFYPCSCSGSIRYIHQDCLEQWLKVANRDQRTCELCGVRFHFTPIYREGAPRRLSLSARAGSLRGIKCRADPLCGISGRPSGKAAKVPGGIRPPSIPTSIRRTTRLGYTRRGRAAHTPTSSQVDRLRSRSGMK